MTNFEFQLATRAKEFPSGDNWIYEPKINGIRLAVERLEGSFRAFGRDGALSLPAHIEGALRRSDVPPGWVLDGEFQFGEDHISSYGVVGRTRPAPVGIFHVFDCCYDVACGDKSDLRARKGRLLRFGSSGPVRQVPWCFMHDPLDVKELYEWFLAAGFEGMVAKRIDSLYTGGKSMNWLKFKR